jgi:membrane protein implicated in regulation of membrane protease activity
MLALYLGALVFGLGVAVVQVLGGGHDADASIDADVDAELGGDAPHGAADHDVAPWTLVLSLRSWSFALLAFGLVGTLLRVLDVATRGVALTVSIAAGLAAGLFASIVVRSLSKRTSTSHATDRDLVGKVARVIVPFDERGVGKIRVDVKGTFVDRPARANEPLRAGEAVVIEDAESDSLTVSKAPREID